MQNKAAEKDAQPYEKKPIYRTVREILREAHVGTAKMGKSYKYTLGEAIRRYAQEAAEVVFVAYEEREDLVLKHQRILAIHPALHRLLINYRIANDLQQVSREDYAAQVERIVSTIRQSEGWAQYIAQEAGKGRNLATEGNQSEPVSRTLSPGGGQSAQRQRPQGSLAAR